MGPSWTSVSRWTSASTFAKRQLCRASWRWCASLPSSCTRVPLRRGFGIGWKRCPRQQEKPNHPTTLAVGHQERRRVEQAFGWRYHCSRWCSSQHPGCSVAQEDREEVITLFALLFNIGPGIVVCIKNKWQFKKKKKREFKKKKKKKKKKK